MLVTVHFSLITVLGEVQEWLNWQHWKCCERETVPWVRIPPSPPSNCGLRISDCGFGKPKEKPQADEVETFHESDCAWRSECARARGYRRRSITRAASARQEGIYLRQPFDCLQN